MIDPKLTYAVVWASNNTDKYGYKVFKDLIDKWFKTIAINPSENEILGNSVYSTLLDYDKKIDVAIFVLPPKVWIKVLEFVKQKWIKKVWFQPGAEDDACFRYCKYNNIEYIANSCIMIQSNK